MTERLQTGLETVALCGALAKYWPLGDAGNVQLASVQAIPANSKPCRIASLDLNLLQQSRAIPFLFVHSPSFDIFCLNHRI